MRIQYNWRFVLTQLFQNATRAPGFAQINPHFIQFALKRTRSRDAHVQNRHRTRWFMLILQPGTRQTVGWNNLAMIPCAYPERAAHTLPVHSQRYTAATQPLMRRASLTPPHSIRPTDRPSLTTTTTHEKKPAPFHSVRALTAQSHWRR